MASITKDDFNVVISHLSVSHTRKNRNLYATLDFDGFKQMKTDITTSTKEGKAAWSQRFDFQYETKYIHKLNMKHFKLNLYKKKSLSADSLVGSVLVDLYTLATGPIDHDILLTKASMGVGRARFKLQMVHVSRIRINVDHIAITNLHKSITSGSSDCTNYLEYSLNNNHINSSPKIEGSLCPTWMNLPPISQIISLKDLVDSQLHFTFKEKSLKDKTLGQLVLPIKNIFSFIEGDTKHINTWLVSMDNEKIADLFVKIQFNEIPQLAQMLEGIHTETGIQNGQPFFSGVPLPKLLGDITNPVPQDIKLPQGWESKMDQFGRTYYVNHNTRQTTWTNPLMSAPVEKKSGSFLLQQHGSSNNSNGNLASHNDAVRKNSKSKSNMSSSNGGEKTKEEKAAILIQRTFRRHRKDVYTKTIRNPSQYRQPSQRPQLPSGWECRIDDYGRPYYLDHMNRTTTWTPPKPNKK
ncbi:WW domain-containing protein [Cavenderia fasciculata]|uniref:WW domain-containing protein n=1 Tax=Cavenderia fasciculata TaxID=261658 RepID=F4Q2U3_CACFS|nr:WW domain-containing protein [Cavenderia fasciculata]EGG16719.1 WW domain-containing protein [Cavenderia fasciculata]|eukprot:XP_004355193.1 WW domain-containing protein [Cavenderia fasciculata]